MFQFEMSSEMKQLSYIKLYVLG